MYKQVIWDVTANCNLACKHCYAAAKYGPDSKKRDLTTVQAKSLLNKLRSAGHRNLLLLGGEPFLREDIFELLQHATRLGFQIMIDTNGTLLSKNMVKQLLQYNITQISVSLQGVTANVHDTVAGKGNFDKAIRGLQNLVEEVEKAERRVLTGIQYTVTKPGLSDFSRLYDFSLELGVDGFSVNFVDDNGRIQNNRELLITPVEYVDALEDLFQNICSSGRALKKECVIQISGKKVLIEYLTQKYCIELTEDLAGYRCPAGQNLFLIQNDGISTPCGIANNPLFYRGEMRNRYRLETVNIMDYESCDALFASGYFRSFHEFLSKKQSVCQFCEFGDFCSACPILPGRELQTCSIARQRLSDWKAEEKNKRINLQLDERLLEYGNTSLARWVMGLFAENWTLNEIIDMVCQKYDVSQELVAEDIWKFYVSVMVYQRKLV